MRGEFKSIKLSFQILTLFIFAIVAHILAGGSVIATPPLVAQLFLISLGCFLLQNKRLEGPALALLIAIVQSTSHFIVGGNTYTNEAAMTFGHLISGVISYHAISNFQESWERILEVLRELLLPHGIAYWAPNFTLPTFSHKYELVCLTQNFRTSLKYRGPPTRLECDHAS
jgi:hypothetical protein